MPEVVQPAIQADAQVIDSLMFSCATQLAPSSLLLYMSATLSVVGSGVGADMLAVTTCNAGNSKANLFDTV
jgi:hypothetical protein